MTAASDLEALAVCVEAAVGADRELDAAIAAAIRYFPNGVGYVWQGSLKANSPEVGRVECCTSLGTGGPHYAAKPYTASLDAAMGLVPGGVNHMETYWPDDDVLEWAVYITPSRGPENDVACGIAKTQVLALCAAALRDRAAMEALP